MTKEQALEQVELIWQVHDDAEMAHGLEDRLQSDFIEALAAGTVEQSDVQAIARIVLTTKKLHFARWCA